MSPPPIPRMRKNEARGNQTQSDAIRCLSYGGHQRPTDAIRPQSDAISVPGALCFRVFVFWGGRKGLYFVFLCFGPEQRACVLCFCVLGRHNGPVFCVFVFWQTPLKTQQGVNLSFTSSSFGVSNYLDRVGGSLCAMHGRSDDSRRSRGAGSARGVSMESRGEPTTRPIRYAT